uniref:Uncharacterized protein LOC111102967 n=1 Tax=Crassostrea virginica TaxID=6565 RepID=A0A8B8AKC2_CRAVI|nr:uncharacterized protein LOC111102967 [Crassostrea virginica]XP_022291632.1 uncharacterized protein LOC111102967 [Crassostrea virginica]
MVELILSLDRFLWHLIFVSSSGLIRTFRTLFSPLSVHSEEVKGSFPGRCLFCRKTLFWKHGHPTIEEEYMFSKMAQFRDHSVLKPYRFAKEFNKAQPDRLEGNSCHSEFRIPRRSSKLKQDTEMERNLEIKDDW